MCVCMCTVCVRGMLAGGVCACGGVQFDFSLFKMDVKQKHSTSYVVYITQHTEN